MISIIQDPVNVLVVDDTEKNLIATEALLAHPGLHIVTARSGLVALELLLEQEFALALIDVNMPEMDGFELAALMRGNTRTKSIPLIFVTAALQESGRAFRGYEAGAVDFLNKPVDPNILRSKVEVFVELYRQRKQLELNAFELKKALSVNEMYNDVLGHDLRSPLQAILNGAELIIRRPDHPNVLSTANIIKSSGLRMANMVNQLLDLARARSGDFRLHLSESDYRIVCEQIVQEYTVPGMADLIDISVGGDTTGTFDKDRVGQVFSNLIGNAVQHRIPDTMIRVRIDGTDENEIVIQVLNDGHIAGSDLDKIFEPYHSASRERQGTSGLGLGLYIVKQLVAAHHGEIGARCNDEEGICFEIRMPRVVASETGKSL